ncbi:MAG: low molecular weight phosphotyrosine protein phosphatase [Burkholderiales bacterium]|nr:low molecular weight phosphotyrosine protein phosphatase [Burkholderiales bacterium]
MHADDRRAAAGVSDVDAPGKDTPRVGVLFVCMGNICRSPTAEGVFRAAAQRIGLIDCFDIDSAGTLGEHAGSPPDRRAIHAARMRGYDISALRARQVVHADFARFDWILAMDRTNLRELTALRPSDFRGHLGLYLDLVSGIDAREVPDPYFGGPQHYELVLDLAEAASDALVARLLGAPNSRAQ